MLKVDGLNPPPEYKSASFPISTASNVNPLEGEKEAKALAIALASKNAAVRFNALKLTPHVTCVPEWIMRIYFCSQRVGQGARIPDGRF